MWVYDGISWNDVGVIRGPTGLQGTTGTQGIQGTQGLLGIQGIQGLATTISDDTTTDSTYYVGYSTTTSGTLDTFNVSSTKLQFNPSTGTLSATIFSSLSDKTQKTNIQPITNALDIINKMNGVYYDWIDNHSQSSVGLIAQEVEEVLPQVVINNANGLKSVSYGNIVAVLIEAIKEQQVRIETLENKLNV